MLILVPAVLLSATVVAPATACVSVRVHVVVGPFTAIAFGVHTKVEGTIAIVNVKACERPYPFAVIVTLFVGVDKLAAFTVKLAEVDPALTVALAGTVSEVELLVRVYVWVTEALLARVSVQLALEALAMIGVAETVGKAQVIEDTGTAATTVKLADWEVAM
jgi:hypothetical protein